ncbi:hypothetical protein NQ314_009569 [Rhamnusium bicolor]|uniref:Uncharacterized protein n=1 Tax=Rhamnusium bicolor TaxID=1586634 RepID=A0AAV8XXZ0_9CUCU|nr:hypothetical protein NQ314_009569 [Rhamnusium bicolor]
MYALQAINEGFLGMSFTNTSPFMAPTRAKKAALGTNPLSLGAPGLNGDSFVLDMATTAVAVGKNIPIPEGWAMNDDGKMETNAEVAYKAGKLMPVGGPEVNSGYKGYGLGVLVEIFSGILSVGQFLNKSHLRAKAKYQFKNHRLPSADPAKPVLVHGDPERIHMEKVKKDGGLLYVQNQHDTNEKLAQELNVKPMVSN